MLKVPDSRNETKSRRPSYAGVQTGTTLSVPSSTRSKSFDSGIDNLSVQEHVKVKASRIVNNVSKPIIGTLLITTKFVAFDPVKKSVYDNADDRLDFHKPAYNGSVSVNLDSVFSVNNYQNLSDVFNEKRIIVEGVTDVYGDSSAKFHDDKGDLYLVFKAIPLSDSYSAPPLSPVSLKPLPKDCKLFAFGIPKDRMEEVYMFLISSIDSACKNAKSQNLQSQFQRPLKTQMVDRSRHNSIVAAALNEFEQEKFKPKLNDAKSDILTDSMLEDIASNFPMTLNGCNLHLVYKTGLHGYSLGTIYRKMKSFDSFTLLLIKDNSNAVFGAFMSDPFRISNHFYGNGETFIFNWKPDFKKYEWTRSNNFFLKGVPNSFAIGATSGHNAIWFEDTLKFGRSEPTDTFDNPTLCGNCTESDQNSNDAIINSLSVDKSILSNNTLSPHGYVFIIDCLEVWRFVA